MKYPYRLVDIVIKCKNISGSSIENLLQKIRLIRVLDLYEVPGYIFEILLQHQNIRFLGQHCTRYYNVKINIQVIVTYALARPL